MIPCRGMFLSSGAEKAVKLSSSGLLAMACRLDRGRFVWPSARDSKVFLTPAQFAMLLEGIDWRIQSAWLTR